MFKHSQKAKVLYLNGLIDLKEGLVPMGRVELNPTAPPLNPY